MEFNPTNTGTLVAPVAISSQPLNCLMAVLVFDSSSKRVFREIPNTAMVCRSNWLNGLQLTQKKC